MEAERDRVAGVHFYQIRLLGGATKLGFPLLSVVAWFALPLRLKRQTSLLDTCGPVIRYTVLISGFGERGGRAKLHWT